MTSRDFCYWLQGFFEVGYPISISPEQTACIKNHLAMVFRHEIDPSHGNPEYVEELRKVHEGISPDTMCVTTTPLASSGPAPKPTIVDQYPDGAPVELPKELAQILPADWLAKLPKGGVGGSLTANLMRL